MLGLNWGCRSSITAKLQEANVTSEHLREAARNHWFWVALVLVVFIDYQLGKDRALSDNAEAVAELNSGWSGSDSDMDHAAQGPDELIDLRDDVLRRPKPPLRPAAIAGRLSVPTLALGE
jgi:hypothetical protein